MVSVFGVYGLDIGLSTVAGKRRCWLSVEELVQLGQLFGQLAHLGALLAL